MTSIKNYYTSPVESNKKELPVTMYRKTKSMRCYYKWIMLLLEWKISAHAGIAYIYSRSDVKVKEFTRQTPQLAQVKYKSKFHMIGHR